MSDSGKAVFLSYAREDAAAGQRIAEALRTHGVEVWFDQNELRGGDAWDAKIRRQIDDCALFIALISQHTQERHKGYFRLEWKLAVDQTHLRAEGVPFVTPVAIDDTPESAAVVPAEFLRAQWTRVPGALPTPQFVEQVKSLLESPHKPAGQKPEAGGQRPEARGQRSEVTVAAKRAGLPGWAWGALAAVVIGGGAFYFAVRPTGKEPVSLTPVAPTAPASEAQRLAARAWALWAKQDDATRDDWMLADQLCQRAVSLEPDNADLWAVQSQVSLGFIIFGFDTSAARYDAARTQAERAVRLAPDSNEAQFALANYYRRQATTRDEGVRMLRQLVERMPTDKRVLRTLASALRDEGRNEESIMYSDRANALPGGDPIALFGKDQALQQLDRPAEGEDVIDQVMAVHPSPAAYLKKLAYVLNFHGDLDQARTLIEKLPAPFLLEEWGAAVASRVWLWRREPDKVLAVLNAVPKDYLEKGPFSGPKAYVTGLARQMKGDPEAAHADWQAALQIVEQRLKAQPNSVELLGWRTLLLGRLGERAECEQALRIYEQLVSAGVVSRGVDVGRHAEIALIEAILGKQGEAVDLVVRLYPQPPPSFRYSPDWDVLRGNPRFEAWLKQSEAKP